MRLSKLNAPPTVEKLRYTTSKSPTPKSNNLTPVRFAVFKENNAPVSAQKEKDCGGLDQTKLIDGLMTQVTDLTFINKQLAVGLQCAVKASELELAEQKQFISDLVTSVERLEEEKNELLDEKKGLVSISDFRIRQVKQDLKAKKQEQSRTIELQQQQAKELVQSKAEQSTLQAEINELEEKLVELTNESNLGACELSKTMDELSVLKAEKVKLQQQYSDLEATRSKDQEVAIRNASELSAMKAERDHIQQQSVDLHAARCQAETDLALQTMDLMAMLNEKKVLQPYSIYHIPYTIYYILYTIYHIPYNTRSLSHLYNTHSHSLSLSQSLSSHSPPRQADLDELHLFTHQLQPHTRQDLGLIKTLHDANRLGSHCEKTRCAMKTVIQHKAVRGKGDIAIIETILKQLKVAEDKAVEEEKRLTVSSPLSDSYGSKRNAKQGRREDDMSLSVVRAEQVLRV